MSTVAVTAAAVVDDAVAWSRTHRVTSLQTRRTHDRYVDGASSATMQAAMQCAYPPLPLLYRSHVGDCTPHLHGDADDRNSNNDSSGGGAVVAVSPWHTRAVHVATPPPQTITAAAITAAAVHTSLCTSIRTPLLPPPPSRAVQASPPPPPTIHATTSRTLVLRAHEAVVRAVTCTHAELRQLREAACLCGVRTPAYLVVDEQPAMTSADDSDGDAVSSSSLVWRRVCLWPRDDGSRRAPHATLPLLTLHADVYTQRTHVSATWCLDGNDDDDTAADGTTQSGGRHRRGAARHASVLYADMCAAAAAAAAQEEAATRQTHDASPSPSPPQRVWCGGGDRHGGMWLLERDAQVCHAATRVCACASASPLHAWLPFTWCDAQPRSRVLLLPCTHAHKADAASASSRTVLMRKRWLCTPLALFMRARQQAMTSHATDTSTTTTTTTLAGTHTQQQRHDDNDDDMLAQQVSMLYDHDATVHHHNNDSNDDTNDDNTQCTSTVSSCSFVHFPCYDGATGLPLLQHPYYAQTTRHVDAAGEACARDDKADEADAMHAAHSDDDAAAVSSPPPRQRGCHSSSCPRHAARRRGGGYGGAAARHDAPLHDAQTWSTRLAAMHTLQRARLSNKLCWFAARQLDALGLTTRSTQTTTTTTTDEQVRVTLPQTRRFVGFFASHLPPWCARELVASDHDDNNDNNDDEAGPAPTRLQRRAMACVCRRVPLTPHNITDYTSSSSSSSLVYVLHLDNDASLRWGAYSTGDATVNFCHALDGMYATMSTLSSSHNNDSNSDDDKPASRLFIDIRAALCLMQQREATHSGTASSSLLRAYAQHSGAHDHAVHAHSDDSADSDTRAVYDATHFVAFLVERVRTLQHWPRRDYEAALQRMAACRHDNIDSNTSGKVRVAKRTATTRDVNSNDDNDGDSDTVDMPAIDRRVWRANARMCDALSSRPATPRQTTHDDNNNVARCTAHDTPPPPCRKLAAQTRQDILRTSAQQRHMASREGANDDDDDVYTQAHDMAGDTTTAVDTATTLHGIMRAERQDYVDTWQSHMRYMHTDSAPVTALLPVTPSPLAQWLRRYGKMNSNSHGLTTTTTTNSNTQNDDDDTVPLWDCGVHVLCVKYDDEYVSAEHVQYADDEST